MDDVPGAGTPDISVVLATYDRRHSLPRAIASVLAQDGVRFELIVVDDASCDGTADYLATLCDPRIRTITAERNSGPSAARNLGLKAARAGMITGVLLAVARVSGETAPLLFTALNNQFWSTDLNAPMASLPVVIFQYALSPYEDWQRLAWTGALLITAAVLSLSIAARYLGSSRTPK